MLGAHSMTTLHCAVNVKVVEYCSVGKSVVEGEKSRTSYFKSFRYACKLDYGTTIVF